MEQEVLSHWCKLIENFEVSPSEFYKTIEKSIEARKVPGLDVSRVDHKEGGLLSDKREYLRLKRQRMWFDICGAPFGKGYFFSSWFVQEVNKVTLFHLLALATLSCMALFFLVDRAGLLWGSLIFLIGLLAAIVVMRNAEQVDLDAAFLSLPLIGPIYEKYFRSVTYYRIDTMQMYQQAVQNAVAEAINEVTAGKGIKPLTEADFKPEFSEVLRK